MEQRYERDDQKIDWLESENARLRTQVQDLTTANVRAAGEIAKTLLQIEEMKKEEQDTRNQYTALKHSAGDRVAELELKNEEMKRALVFIGTADPCDVRDSFWKMREAANNAFQGKTEKPKCQGCGGTGVWEREKMVCPVCKGN